MKKSKELQEDGLMIKLSFSNCPNMGDLKLVLAALELQPHSRAEMRKEEL